MIQMILLLIIVIVDIYITNRSFRYAKPEVIKNMSSYKEEYKIASLLYNNIKNIDFVNGFIERVYGDIDNAIHNITIYNMYRRLYEFRGVIYLLIGLIFPYIMAGYHDLNILQIIGMYAVFIYVIGYTMKLDMLIDVLPFYTNTINTGYFYISRLYLIEITTLIICISSSYTKDNIFLFIGLFMISVILKFMHHAFMVNKYTDGKFSDIIKTEKYKYIEKVMSRNGFIKKMGIFLLGMVIGFIIINPNIFIK